MGELQALLSSLDELLEDPCRRMREVRASHGRPIVAYLPPDLPEEIIHAAGAVPFPLLGSAPSESRLASTVPSFLCPPVRIALGRAEHGELSFAGGFVFPFMCDSTKALAQLWRPHAGGRFTHALCLPRLPDRAGAEAFLFHEFLRLKERLEEATGVHASETDLRASIRLYNENRALLRQLGEGVHRGRSGLEPAGFYRLVRASMFMPKEEHSALVRRFLALPPPAVPSHENAPRVFLCGYWAEPRELFTQIAGAGMRIVGDNLHDGTRYFEVDAEEQGDPLAALARRQARRSPSSCFHYSDAPWPRYLANRVQELGAEGVVYVSPSRCDPMDFDYPAIRDALEAVNVPLLALQAEFAGAPDAQAGTRLAAFGELLRGRRDEP
ncbi:MAG: 2-hydroxyacyl-CoA dehydratase [Deltaproteobacteria bacterium]|nr:2-hydroxyacyl-CoA dehydratase [Deltaproteobacteria bacterium]